MITYFGYLILIIFIIFLLHMIKEGPFIFQTGTKYFIPITDLNFDVNNITIKKGDTIEFVNYDQIRHTVITDDQIIKNSDLLFQYDIYKHTFRREGIFTFKSSLYKNMDPIIVTVEETPKGRSFYNEIFSNIINFIKELFSTILFYIRYTLVRVIY